MTETFSLTDPIFASETTAREHFEVIRWPDGPVCPHCGSTGERNEARRQIPSSWSLQCTACREPFTVKMASVMDKQSHFLSETGARVHLMASSKKGMSAHQLHRMLGVTYKTVWFLAHRIREAMREISRDALGSSIV